MQVRCKYCTILYKGLEHPWILVSMDGPEINIPQMLRDGLTVHFAVLEWSVL